MKISIALGGSILVPEDIDMGYIKNFVALMNKLSGKHEIGIVSGGGKTARRYIKAARELGCSEYDCDIIGVECTRVNARLLSLSFGKKANKEIPVDVKEAAKGMQVGRIVVMGGTTPHHSTDAVAAMLAEESTADLFIKATDVDGIYDKDPQKYKNAKKFDKITLDELSKLVKNESQNAGQYALIDKLAVEVIKRSKLQVAFLNGRDLKNLEKAICGLGYEGTKISWK